MQYILTEEEYNELKRDCDNEIYNLEKELNIRTRECLQLREENRKLKAKIEMMELTSPYNNDNKKMKDIFNKAASDRGFNF